MCSGMVSSSCSTCNTRRVKICVQSRNNEMIKQVSNNVFNLGIKDRLKELVQLCFIKTNVHEDANTLFSEGSNLIL